MDGRPEDRRCDFLQCTGCNNGSFKMAHSSLEEVMAKSTGKNGDIYIYIYIYTYVYNMKVCVCVYIHMLAMSWDFSTPSHNSLTFLFSLLHFCFKYFTLTSNVYS